MKKILKRITFYILFCFSFITLNVKQGYTAKIIAVVGESVITDLDAEDFSQILCIMQNMKKCDTKSMFPMSVMTLVDANIKAEHMTKLGISNNDFLKGYGEYKHNILKQIKLNNNINKEQFEWFLFNEYKWNAIVASMLRDTKITNDEIRGFMEKNKDLKLSKEQAHNILFNKKLEEKSRSLVNEAKKYYLVDIKI